MTKQRIILLYTLILLGCYLGNAQEGNARFAINYATNLTVAVFSDVESNVSSCYFYNPKRAVVGKEYFFDDLDNIAVVNTKDSYKYVTKNINLIIKKNLFLSKLSEDFIFTENINITDRIVLDNKINKNIYYEKGRTIYEVIFESEQFSI